MHGNFGMPGPMELIVIGLVCLGPLVAAIAAVLLVVYFVRRNASPPSAPCPKCGGWTVPASRFCHHCGGSLQGPQQQDQA